MKLKQQTLDILKNFAQINSNIVIEAGNTVTTIADTKNIMATATIPDTIGAPLNIYDLNEFLSVYDMMNSLGDPDVDVSQDAIRINADKSKLTYRQADKSILTYPQKSINMPVAEVKFCISDTTLKSVKRAATVLGHTAMSISGDGASISVGVFNPSDLTANRFTVESVGITKHTFEFHFLIGSLKLLPGDYDVELSSKLISKWSNPSMKVEYFIAIEKTSTFKA